MENKHIEFRKYAVKHHRIGSLHVDSYINRQANLPTGMTPYIIEERQLNVAQMDVFSRLMMDRIIFLGEPVAATMANIIQAQLLFLQSLDTKKDIQLYINSPGGDVYTGMGIYDTMQLITPNVATLCVGMACSMSAVLLCAGYEGKRAALQHSQIMIHQPSGGVQGQSADIEITAQQIIRLRKSLYQIVAKHSGQSYEWVHQASDRDYWMTGAEAKVNGIIDEVLGNTD